VKATRAAGRGKVAPTRSTPLPIGGSRAARAHKRAPQHMSDKVSPSRQASGGSVSQPTSVRRAAPQTTIAHAAGLN